MDFEFHLLVQAQGVTVRLARAGAFLVPDLRFELDVNSLSSSIQDPHTVAAQSVNRTRFRVRTGYCKAT